MTGDRMSDENGDCKHGLVLDDCSTCKDQIAGFEDTNPFRARFTGKCRLCGQPVEPGEVIVKRSYRRDFEYLHDICS